MKKYLLLITLLCSVYLNAEMNVLAFAGSTRLESVNKKLVNQAARIAREMGASVTVLDLKNFPMPIYEADLEASEGMPENTKQFRQWMINSPMIFISSPQNNASVSALLKNVIDWCSRGENGGSSREAYKGKKFVLMSASPNKKGGAKGLIHLKAIIEDCGGEVFPIQISIPDAYNAFDENGNLKDPNQTQALTDLVRQALQ